MPCGCIGSDDANFIDARRSKCIACVDSDWYASATGICLPTAEKHGTDKADIEHGIARASLQCPKGEWGSVAVKCPKCKRAQLQVFSEEAGMCAWCQIKHGCTVPNVSTTTKAKVDRPTVPTRRFGSGGSSFRATGEPQWVSVQQLAADAASLASIIPSDVQAIVGVARSGITPASMIATLLHLPLLAIRQTKSDVIEVGNGWRLGGSTHIDTRAGAKVAIVDDTVMTGNSLRAIKDVVQSQFPNHVTCAIYVNPLAKRKPDIWVHDLGWPHVLEWNVFNSVLSPNIAMDFDGILCDDCPPGADDDGTRYSEWMATARPKYLPRKSVVPMIVTARIEKYRGITEAWLARHGVRTHALIMHPAKNLRQRQRDDIAAFKAHHYGEWAKKYKPIPPPLMFIESEDWQAKRINELTGKMTVCPASRTVYP